MSRQGAKRESVKSGDSTIVLVGVSSFAASGTGILPVIHGLEAHATPPHPSLLRFALIRVCASLSAYGVRQFFVDVQAAVSSEESQRTDKIGGAKAFRLSSSVWTPRCAPYDSETPSGSSRATSARAVATDVREWVL